MKIDFKKYLNKFNLTHKQFLYGGIGLILFYSLGCYFYYSSQKKKITSSIAELKSVEGQIEKIEEILVEGQSADRGILSLEEKLKALEFKFPQKEEEGIRLLSDFAREKNMDILSLMPQPKRPFLDQKSKKVVVEGQTVQRLLVSMNMTGTYFDLINFMEKLKKDLPAFVTFEKIRIYKNQGGSSLLKVDLDITIYLLSVI